MKILNATLAVLFLVFTIVQINDPDPYYWMFIYISMTGFSLLAFSDRFFPKIMLLFVGGYLHAMFQLRYGIKDWLVSEDLSLLFEEFAKMQYPYIEESREFLGLTICLMALGIFYFQYWKSIKKA